VLSALLTLISCGDVPSEETPPTADPWTQTLEAPVVEARRVDADSPRLVVVARHLDCARLQGREQDRRPDTVWVQVLQVIPAHLQSDDCGGAGRQSLTVRLDGPVGDRQLVVNTVRWGRPGQLGSLRPCRGVFGCGRPPTDHCDGAWIKVLLQGVEQPPERHTTTVACDGEWMVLDVTATVTGCQGVGDATPPPGCTSSTRRWFAYFDETLGRGGWDVLASGTEPGCVPVREALPEFPSELCDGLPPAV
jgi:hypothetical protein